MRLLIVGAGAIGSLVGNRLARAGHEVTLVGRPGYVAAVREQGLGLEEAGRRVYVKDVRATTHVAEVAAESFDLIIFTMKAYDTAMAAAQVQPLARQGIPILVLQNGVGGEEIVAQRLGEVSILSAVITLVVEACEPGLVRLSTTRGGIGLAAWQSSSPDPTPLARSSASGSPGSSRLSSIASSLSFNSRKRSRSRFSNFCKSFILIVSLLSSPTSSSLVHSSNIDHSQIENN